MRMPTKAPSRSIFFSLLVGASLLTACSGSGLTAPQAASRAGTGITPKGRSETGYVVAERGDTLETLINNTTTRTMDGLEQTLGGGSKKLLTLP
jgi:hypothetical protein